MDNSLKVLDVALQKGNYNLAAHALVYGMVKASISVSEKTDSPVAIPTSGIVGPAAIKVIPLSNNTNATPAFIPVCSRQVISAKTKIRISANPSFSENRIKNREERE